MDVDEFFNIKVIISELESCLNGGDVIDTSVIIEVQIKHQMLEKYYKKKTHQWVKWVKKMKLLLFPKK